MVTIGATAVITHKAGAKGTVAAESEGIASVRGKTLSRQQMSTIVGDGASILFVIEHFYVLIIYIN